jgi:hypothetical protein
VSAVVEVDDLLVGSREHRGGGGGGDVGVHMCCSGSTQTKPFHPTIGKRLFSTVRLLSNHQPILLAYGW